MVLKTNRQNFNRCCAEAAASYENVRLLRVSDFVDGQGDIMNEQFTHFDRKVYHRLYMYMTAAATAELESRIEPAA
jgi:hypothetical protein